MPKLNNKCYSLVKNGNNADITMYGEVVDSQPYDFWTGKPVEGSFIIKDEFLADLEELAECEEITIHMDSVGGDTAVGLLIHNKLRDLSQAGKKLNCIVDGVAMSGLSHNERLRQCDCTPHIAHYGTQCMGKYVWWL